MSNEDILKRISEEIAELTPDNFEIIKEKCEHDKKKNVINITSEKKSKFSLKIIISAVAVFAVVFCAIFGVATVNSSVDSIIGIDVNPSLQIKTNKQNKVLSVKPLNDDAVTIVDNMDFKGTDLRIAVNALIGSMLRKGYITEIQNSVLVSIENKNAERRQLIMKEITDDISEVLNESNISAVVLTQNLNGIHNTITELAAFYGISEGKAALISEICQNSDKCDFASLVGLSVSELTVIAQSKKNVSDNICVSGKTSNVGCISIEKAKETALADCNVKEADIGILDVELECDDGILVYEVSFCYGNCEYTYEINVLNGDIIAKEKEHVDKSDNSFSQTTQTIQASQTMQASQTAQAVLTTQSMQTAQTTQNAYTQSTQQTTQSNQGIVYIGNENAKNIALSHAGVSESNITNYKNKLDTDKGVVIYEIEFDSGNYEYEYTINASTGKVIAYSKEKTDIYANNTTVAASSDQSFIGESKAKQIAFGHAGISESDAKNVKVKLKKSLLINIYEVEFDAVGYEYEYEINAVTGIIRKCDKECDDSYHVDPQTTVSTAASTGSITKAEAKLIALKHAGTDENCIRSFESELKYEKGKHIYEIEFELGNYEYEYKIDALNGKIISYEKETDD